MSSKSTLFGSLYNLVHTQMSNMKQDTLIGCLKNKNDKNKGNSAKKKHVHFDIRVRVIPSYS